MNRPEGYAATCGPNKIWQWFQSNSNIVLRTKARKHFLQRNRLDCGASYRGGSAETVHRESHPPPSERTAPALGGVAFPRKGDAVKWRVTAVHLRIVGPRISFWHYLMHSIVPYASIRVRRDVGTMAKGRLRRKVLCLRFRIDVAIGEGATSHQRRSPMWQRGLGAALIIPRPCCGTRAGACGPHGRQLRGFRALQFARATIAHGWSWRSASLIRYAIHTGRLPTPRLPGPILLAHTR
jgi:hypothetical protein